MFNGVLQYDDTLAVSSSAGSNDFGYAMFNDPQLFPQNIIFTTAKYQCLSSSPTTQYARLTDYGTLPFLNFLLTNSNRVSSVKFTYYWDGGSLSEVVNFNALTGGTNLQNTSKIKLGYLGAFPANLKNWSSTFATAVTNGLTYYTVQLTTNTASPTETYTINILCPNEKGYEGIRLTWLNKWGTWDYYTFNMKSTRSITTNRTSYTQLGGTWNESRFKISGYKGGKKNFRVNSTEKIKLNTDFVTEEESVWFEQLINSPEVYVLEGFQTDISASIYSLLNNYVQPARVTNSSYIRKTIANDKLMQYTFEIEKSKIKRTQAI